MADGDRITIEIEGLPEDDGQVRLSAFMTELQNLSATIARLDRDANDGRSATYLRIAQLSYSSPAKVVLEPTALPSQKYAGAVLIENLRSISHALKNGSDLTDLDAELLEDIRGLAKPVGKTVKSATLIFGNERLDLTQKIANRVDAALAVEDECEGFMDGMLEQINIHGGANTFHIYPDVGPTKVTCHFPPKLYEDAVAAVGRRVEVSGTLRYRIRAPYPHQIAVAGVTPFPPDDELPDWEDLRGRAPAGTGGLSSEAFVRDLRDAWR